MANGRLKRIKRLVDVRESALQRCLADFHERAVRLQEAEAELAQAEEAMLKAKIEFRKLATRRVESADWRLAQEWHVSRQARAERSKANVLRCQTAHDASRKAVAEARLKLKQVEILADRAKLELLAGEKKQQDKSDAEHAMRIALAGR